jgi:hypothetical protein
VAYYFRFAVLADCLKAFAVGAPFAPGFLIFSPLPALIRFRLAWMFAYSPFFFAAINQPFFHLLELDFVLLGFHLTLSARYVFRVTRFKRLTLSSRLICFNSLLAKPNSFDLTTRLGDNNMRLCRMTWSALGFVVPTYSSPC